MTGREDLFAVRTVNRREAQLLLYCVAADRAPDTVARIGALLREDLDWPYLLRTAGRHGVAPLLYRNLETSTHQELVPEDVMDRLRGRFQSNGRHNLLLTGKLFEILDAFDARGVQAIPYKGPVLAAVAYRNLALREFGDLDFLLCERDVLRAKEVLTSLGYRPKDQMTDAQEAAFLRYERQYEFSRDDGVVVELQWKVVPRYLTFPLDAEYLLERTEQVSLGGRRVQTCSREDLLLILCVHGAVHRWERLGWICDIAQLVRDSGDLDWGQLLERSGALKSKRMLILGLLLANRLLSTGLDPEVLREVRADPAVERLATEVCERLFLEDWASQSVLEGSAFRGFHFQTLERVRDKLRYCVHRLMTPTLWEWRLLPLPAALFPCYRLLRPSLLTGKLGVRLAKRFLGANSQSRLQ